MSFLREIDLGDGFEPFRFFRSNFGFVPALFRAQSLLPRALNVETELTNLLLVQPGALTPEQKQMLLLIIAAEKQNSYCVSLHWQTLRSLGVTEEQIEAIVKNHHLAKLGEADVALLDFGLKLSRHPLWIQLEDIEVLRANGLSDEQILEAELIISYGVFACTLSTGLGIAPDFEAKGIGPSAPFYTFDPNLVAKKSAAKTGPYLRAVDLPEDFWPYPFLQAKLGFIPSYFRAQTLRPDFIEAQTRALDAVLLPDDVLSRLQKEYIFLVISASNLNTFCIANHCGVLRGLGIPEDQSDQIAFNHRDAGLSAKDVALLDFALKLTQEPSEFSETEIQELRRTGFTDEQILDGVVLSGFANFINTMNVALGVLPDFEPRHVFTPEHLSAQHDLKLLGEISSTKVNLFRVVDSLIDEDAGVVARVCGGDTEAFEELVRRHHQRVYRTLISITGNPDEAEDYSQNVFLKAFKNLAKFERTAKFSTWLTRIAINEGIERLRQQGRLESFDEVVDENEIRPRQVQAWADDPEQSYSRKEMRKIVETEMMKLPTKYRLAVMLRDLEQLSNQEAAASMNLGLEAFKSRLLRGRLALREALAPKFKVTREGAARV